MKAAIGDSDYDKHEVVTSLNTLLAEEYVLYTKTRNAHWNVDGSNSFEQHVFFENQYIALDEVIDEVAERIRSLGHFALGSLKDFLNAAQISEVNNDFGNPEQILRSLVNDHEAIMRNIRNDIIPISDKYKDPGTADFVTGLLAKHEKMAWMHRLFLSQPDTSAIEQY